MFLAPNLLLHDYLFTCVVKLSAPPSTLSLVRYLLPYLKVRSWHKSARVGRSPHTFPLQFDMRVVLHCPKEMPGTSTGGLGNCRLRRVRKVPTGKTICTRNAKFYFSPANATLQVRRAKTCCSHRGAACSVQCTTRSSKVSPRCFCTVF